MGAGSDTVPVTNVTVFRKWRENSWSSGYSASSLTSLPLYPALTAIKLPAEMTAMKMQQGKQDMISSGKLPGQLCP